MSTQKNTEKLTDKAFSRMWVSSIVGILICLACLCSTTWAWFSAGTTSSQNVIQSGEGKLTVTVTKQANAADDQGEIITDIEQVKMCDAGTYTVKMTLPKDSASGYCVVHVGEDAYRSPYILRSQEAEQTVTFYIKLAAKTALSIETRWGIYSDETADVNENETLQIGAVSSVAEQETNQQE